jgi:Glycosyl transferases group 1
MNVYVLSQNGPENNHVGWAVSRDLEAVLAHVFDAQFLYPSKVVLPSWRSLPGRVHQRLFKSWFELENLPTLGKGCNVLLIVGMLPHFLLSMHALGPVLKQFDLRIGYVLDAFDAQVVDAAIAPHLDHLFVIDAELAEEVHQRGVVPTQFIPVATNLIGTKLNSGRRKIDVLSYGRRNELLHQQLLQHLRKSDSSLFYHYSTLLYPDAMDRDEHQLMQSQLLDLAKVSLCFDASDQSRFYGRSPLLYRWLEAWAHGCAVVGCRPTGRGVMPLMDWENSTLELPADSSDWLPFLEALLADQEALTEISRRNYQEALQRHDWRYRLQDMWQILGLPIPAKLQADIQELGRRSQPKALSAIC